MILKKKKCTWGAIFCILLSTALGMPNFHAKAAETQQKTVKVGYYNNEIFQEGTSDDDIKTGYSYDYLQKVSSLTGWRYEYMYGTWTECYQAFINGEVDLLAGLGYSEDRLQYMYYPDYEMGHERYYLYTLSDNATISTDTITLHGKKIGVLSGLMEKQINNWIKEKEINAEIIVYGDTTERNNALINKELDAIYAEASSVSLTNGILPVYSLGDSSMYLCVNINRPDLYQELNTALATLNQLEPYYLSQLAETYQNEKTVNITLTASETAWINRHSVINIGYLDNFLPFCDQKENGEINGNLRDVTKRLFENMKLTNSCSLNYIAYENFDELIEALTSEEIDIIFPAYNNNWFLEKHDIFASNSIMPISMNLIYNGQLVNFNSQRIALVKNNYIQEQYVLLNYPDAELVYYDSYDDCLDAVERGTAKCTIISILNSQNYTINARYTSLHEIPLSATCSISYAVSRDNIDLLSVLNKGLKTLSSSYALTTTYNYSPKVKYSLYDLIRENIISSFIIFSIGLLTVVCLFAYIIYKTKQQRATDRMAHIDQMTNLLNRRSYEEEIEKLKAFLPHNFVYISIDVNGLKTVNDTLGHAAGDELIQGMSQCLTKAFPEGTKIFRTGGDEFIVFLYDSKKHADLLLEEFFHLAAKWKGNYVSSLSSSYGIVCKADFENCDIDILIAAADEALYKNKHLYYKSLKK